MAELITFVLLEWKMKIFDYSEWMSNLQPSLSRTVRRVLTVQPVDVDEEVVSEEHVAYDGEHVDQHQRQHGRQ